MAIAEKKWRILHHNDRPCYQDYWHAGLVVRRLMKSMTWSVCQYD